MKRINLLLCYFILSFGIEDNYCSDNVGGNENFDGRHVGQDAVQKEIISGFLSFFLFFILPNFSYCLFDWYQKKRGWYFYKYYYCIGYRTRLYYKIFYLDFYLRFFILRLVYAAIAFFCCLLYSVDIRDEKVYYGLLVNFSPEVDLNIRLGKKFYLVIGFKDIFYCALFHWLIKRVFF